MVLLGSRVVETGCVLLAGLVLSLGVGPGCGGETTRPRGGGRPAAGPDVFLPVEDAWAGGGFDAGSWGDAGADAGADAVGDAGGDAAGGGGQDGADASGIADVAADAVPGSDARLPPDAAGPARCILNSDCPPGAYCGDDGRCRSDCDGDEDCGGGTCDRETGRCRSVGCRWRGDCPEGAVCAAVTDAEASRVDLMCVPPGEGAVPYGGRCVGRGNECAEQVCLRDVGRCSRICRDDGDCAEGDHCGMLTFFKPEVGLEEVAVPACAPGVRCSSGRDCPGGQVCGGADPVPPGERAAPYCVAPGPGATPGESCVDAAACGVPLCVAGRCSVFCGSHADCPAEEVCVPVSLLVGDVPLEAGLCFPPCGRRRDCGGGSICSGHVLDSERRRWVSFCDTPAGGATRLGAACRQDGDCVTGWCFDGHCAEFCLDDADCDPARRILCFTYRVEVPGGGEQEVQVCEPE